MKRLLGLLMVLCMVWGTGCAEMETPELQIICNTDYYFLISQDFNLYMNSSFGPGLSVLQAVTEADDLIMSIWTKDYDEETAAMIESDHAGMHMAHAQRIIVEASIQETFAECGAEFVQAVLVESEEMEVCHGVGAFSYGSEAFGSYYNQGKGFLICLFSRSRSKDMTLELLDQIMMTAQPYELLDAYLATQNTQ